MGVCTLLHLCTHAARMPAPQAAYAAWFWFEDGLVDLFQAQVWRLACLKGGVRINTLTSRGLARLCILLFVCRAMSEELPQQARLECPATPVITPCSCFCSHGRHAAMAAADGETCVYNAISLFCVHISVMCMLRTRAWCALCVCALYIRLAVWCVSWVISLHCILPGAAMLPAALEPVHA